MSLSPDEFLPLARRLPEPLLLVDLAGIVVAVNPAAEDVLGLDGGAPGTSLAERIEESPEKLREYLRQCARSSRFLPGRFTCAGPDGGIAYRCEGMAARTAGDPAPPRILLRLLANERAGMRFALLDRKIDELARENSRRRAAEAERERLLDAERQARREAEEANRLKDDFLATVSHELRTPLNVISGWVDLLAGDHLPEERRRRGLETIARNARALTRLVEDLLDLSRIVTGGLRLDVEPVELQALVQAAVDAVTVAAEAKQIEVAVVATEDGAGIVSGDPARLQQVLWNLLTNAIKFTPRGGRVEVSIRRVASQLEVAVADNGPGIDADFLPHVFEPFRQHDSSITRVHQGLGLGLAIVRRLVEGHGGTVSVESPGAGQGATFRIRLPLRALSQPALVAHAGRAAAPAESAVAPAARRESLEGVRVLVVEDEPDARELLIALFESRGARVAAAASAREARELLPRQTPDVLVSDIQMPGEDGYQLLRTLRASGGPAAEVPAVALTAHGRRQDRLRALRAGFQLHVTKPVEPEELVAVVASLVRHPAAPASHPGALAPPPSDPG